MASSVFDAEAWCFDHKDYGVYARGNANRFLMVDQRFSRAMSNSDDDVLARFEIRDKNNNGWLSDGSRELRRETSDEDSTSARFRRLRDEIRNSLLPFLLSRSTREVDVRILKIRWKSANLAHQAKLHCAHVIELVRVPVTVWEQDDDEVVEDPELDVHLRISGHYPRRYSIVLAFEGSVTSEAKFYRRAGYPDANAEEVVWNAMHAFEEHLPKMIADPQRTDKRFNHITLRVPPNDVDVFELEKCVGEYVEIPVPIDMRQSNQ